MYHFVIVFLCIKQNYSKKQYFFLLYLSEALLLFIIVFASLTISVNLVPHWAANLRKIVSFICACFSAIKKLVCAI